MATLAQRMREELKASSPDQVSFLLIKQIEGWIDEVENMSDGSQPVHTTSVVLDDGQIKALPSTPVVVIADPGIGKLIIPQLFFFRMDPANYVDYSNIDAEAQIFLGSLSPVFGESTGNAVSGLLADTGYGDAVSTTEQLVTDPVALTRPLYGWSDGDIAGALHINAYNGSVGDFTGGDPDNTLQIAASYFVFDIATGAFVSSS